MYFWTAIKTGEDPEPQPAEQKKLLPLMKMQEYKNNAESPLENQQYWFNLISQY